MERKPDSENIENGPSVDAGVNPNIPEESAPADPRATVLEGRRNMGQALFQLLKRHFTYEWVTAVATAISAVASAIGLILLWLTVATSLRVAQGEQNMLYSERLQEYNHIHKELEKGGKWYSQDCGPETADEWFDVRRYMGLLEHMEVLLSNEVLTPDTADKQLSHRVYAIYRNGVIRSETTEKREGIRWQNFLAVVKRLKGMKVFRELEKESPMHHSINPTGMVESSLCANIILGAKKGSEER